MKELDDIDETQDYSKKPSKKGICATRLIQVDQIILSGIESAKTSELILQEMQQNDQQRIDNYDE